MDEPSFLTPELKPQASYYSFAPHKKEDNSPNFLRAAGSFNCSIYSGRKSLAHPSQNGLCIPGMELSGKAYHLESRKDASFDTFGILPVSQQSRISLVFGTARSRISQNTISQSTDGPKKQTPILQPTGFLTRLQQSNQGLLTVARRLSPAEHSGQLAGQKALVRNLYAKSPQAAVSRLGMITKRESLKKLRQHQGDIECPNSDSGAHVLGNIELEKTKSKLKLENNLVRFFKGGSESPEPRRWGLTNSSVDTLTVLAPISCFKAFKKDFRRRSPDSNYQKCFTSKILAFKSTSGSTNSNKAKFQGSHQTSGVYRSDCCYNR